MSIARIPSLLWLPLKKEGRWYSSHLFFQKKNEAQERQESRGKIGIEPDEIRAIPTPKNGHPVNSAAKEGTSTSIFWTVENKLSDFL